MNHCYVGGYWYGRAEPKESCVSRATRYFARLRAHDEALREWLPTSDTLREALAHFIEMDPASLAREFQLEQTGPGDETHSFHAWNGELFGWGALLDLDCGGASIWSSGLALLRLPRRGPAADRLCTLESITALVRLTVELWEPEWAVATSREFRDAILGKGELPRPFIGWLTYASRLMAPSIPPLEGAAVEAFAGGHLISLAESHPPGAGSGLVKAARQIDTQLRRDGLLTSTREKARGAA